MCENRKETADLSTSLCSGRDDKFVRPWTGVIHWIIGIFSATNLSSRPESWACGPPKVMKKRLGRAPTLYGTVALSFVIPSEAEGSAVPRTILEMFFNRAQRSREISGFFSVLTHPLYPNSLSILYCPTKEAAEKPEFFEGDGLQAVHNCFVVSAALAAEGAVFLQPGLLPQPLKSLP